MLLLDINLQPVAKIPITGLWLVRKYFNYKCGRCGMFQETLFSPLPLDPTLNQVVITTTTTKIQPCLPCALSILQCAPKCTTALGSFYPFFCFFCFSFFVLIYFCPLLVLCFGALVLLHHVEHCPPETDIAKRAFHAVSVLCQVP